MSKITVVTIFGDKRRGYLEGQTTKGAITKDCHSSQTDEPYLTLRQTEVDLIHIPLKIVKEIIVDKPRKPKITKEEIVS